MNIFLQRDSSTEEPIGVWASSPSGEVDSYFVDDEVRRSLLDEAGPDVADDWTEFSVWLRDELHLSEADGSCGVEDSLEAALCAARQSWAGTSGVPGTSKFEAAVRRRRFASMMELLAQQVVGDTTGHSAALKWPSPHVARVTEDDGALVIGVPAGETKRDIDALLATGLVLQEDRDLHLLLPDVPRNGEDGERIWEATATRTSWLDTSVWLWSYDPLGEVRPIATPGRPAALASLRQTVPIPLAAHDLGSTAAWVDALTSWADAQDDLRRADRPSYRAWHVDGRKVLELQLREQSLQVAAGQHPDSVTIRLEGPLDEAGLSDAQAAIAAAVSRRLSGEDDGDAESRLQSRLADTPEQLSLVGPLVRELPVRRPGSPEWAFLDLVGVDSKGNVHLVETKVKRDWMLGLQALDYWLWGKANLELLAAELRRQGVDVADQPKLFIDVVVGNDAGDATPGDIRLLLPQLEALAGSIAWRIGDITGWREDDTSVEWFRRGIHPLPERRHLPSRFAFRLQEHLLQRSPSSGHRGARLFLDPTDWTTAKAQPALNALDDAGKLHHMVGHVRSSQLFALNLFGGLDQPALLAALTSLDPLADLVSCEAPVFEFEDQDDRLGEATKASPHRTQVDVLLAGTSAAGDSVAVLVEVKLSEVGFGSCSAATAKNNDRTDLCATPAPFGGEPAGCFQLRNKSNGGRRTYDEHLGNLDAAEEPPRHGCPFRDNNQPMRNLALAGALVNSGQYDRAVFVTCAHDAHDMIWRRYRDAVAQTPHHTAVGVAALPASTVLAQHAHEDRSVLADRYDLTDAVDRAWLTMSSHNTTDGPERRPLELRRPPTMREADEIWGMAPPSVTGFSGPWGDAIVQLNRVLLEPQGGHAFPAAPRTGDPHAHALGYWTAVLHLLVSRIGWVDAGRGLDAWNEAGQPAIDTQTAFLRDVILADGQLPLLHEWLRTGAASSWVDAVSEAAGLPPVIVARPAEPDPRVVDDAVHLDVWNPLTGGTDPLHLTGHIAEAYSTEVDHRGAEMFASDEVDRRAVLVLNTAEGWYAQLAGWGAALPELPDGSWDVEVVARGAGSLGNFRRSPRTGLWFQGEHAIHLLAYGPDGCNHIQQPGC